MFVFFVFFSRMGPWIVFLNVMSIYRQFKRNKCKFQLYSLSTCWENSKNCHAVNAFPCIAEQNAKQNVSVTISHSNIIICYSILPFSMHTFCSVKIFCYACWMKSFPNMFFIRTSVKYPWRLVPTASLWPPSILKWSPTEWTHSQAEINPYKSEKWFMYTGFSEFFSKYALDTIGNY